MQVIPKGSPTSPEQPQNAQPSARDRAIAKLQGSPAQSQEHPVQDPSHVSPEELSAVKASTIEEGQTNTNETPEAPKAVVTEDKALSPQYAALARKEKALRSQVQQLNATKQAFQAEQEASKAKLAEAQAALDKMARLQKDPWSVLNELGVSYDDITAQALNQPTPQDKIISRLEAKIEALENAGKQTNENFEKQQTQAYQQAVEQIRTETRNLVKQDPNFETIQATGSVNDVVKLIEITFKEGLDDEYPKGTLLTVEQACKMVEDELVEQAMSIAKLKKIQARLAPAPAKEAAADTKPQTPQQPQMKTLTNSIGATKKLSSRDRAILAFKGELKN